MIRTFRPDDLEACAATLARLGDWFGDAQANAAYLAALPLLPTFVLIDEGDVRGFLALQLHAAGSAEIHVMGVDPLVHRHGFGRALVATAERWCATERVRWLHVKTRGPRTYDEPYGRTRAFYRALGFEVLYESLTEWGPRNAALVLVKHLPCSVPLEAD